MFGCAFVVVMASVARPSESQRLARGRLNNEIKHYMASDDLETAKHHAQAAVAENRRGLGRQHPSTLNAQVCLAVVLWRAGARRESEAMMRSTLASMETVLGPAHDDTRTCRDNLVVALRQRGLEEEAAALAKANVRRRTGSRLLQ
jgi:hypothetical protein